jgi:cell division GTPase FtsZ
MELKKFMMKSKTTSKNNITFVSMGGAGNAILHSLTQETDIVNSVENQSIYINFSASDMSDKYIGHKLMINEGGTGRSKEHGAELVQSNKERIFDFFSAFYNRYIKNSDEDKTIVFISSFGGGTGSSILPLAIQFFANLKDSKLKLMTVGILSSPKEGVATLPNCIKTYNDIYNNYVLPGSLHNLILFDNEKFESEAGSVYNFPKMNSHIVSMLESFFSRSEFETSGSGYQTLDTEEVKRVTFFGKGVCDFSLVDLQDLDSWNKYESSINNGGIKSNTAKAIACLIRVKGKDQEYSKEFIDKLHLLAEKVKKKTGSGFFVWGLSFGNKNLETPVQLQIILNGLESPSSLTTDIKKAKKEVEKIKKANENYVVDGIGDLNF